MKWIKPPIGVLDKKYYHKFLKDDIEMNGGMCLEDTKLKRLNNLKGAIERYLDANLHIDTEWLNEYNEILNEMGICDKRFTLK